MANATTLVGLLQKRSFSNPCHPIYTFLSGDPFEEQSVTYEQLDRRARSVAARLQSRCHLGDRVLLLHKSGIEFITAFFGCLYAGVIPVTAYPPRHGRKMPGLESMASDSEARIALTDSDIFNDLDACFKEAPVLRRLDWFACDLKDQSLQGQWIPPDLSGDALAYLQYTSGSTSRPKGVMIDHASLLCNLRHLENGFLFSSKSVMVSWLPVYHDMGLIMGLLQSIFSGGTCVFMAPAAFAQRPFRWLKAISDYQATHSTAPNFAYDLCVDTIGETDRRGLDLSSWFCAINAAETVRMQTIDRFNRAFAPLGFKSSALKPSYGLAEAVLRVTCTLPEFESSFCTVDAESLAGNKVVEVEQDSPNGRVIVGCGSPDPETEICIVDPSTLKKCELDSVGEIWVKGLSIAKGYWQNAEATQHTFGATLADSGEGPWLRTGDLGFIKSGDLFVVGRLKELIIIRGSNYYPQDVELTVQQSHTDLQPDAGAAFSVDSSGEERLVVVQEVRRTSVRKLDTNSVTKAVRSAIYSEHGIELSELVLVRPVSVSKTSSGKIMRNFIRQCFLEDELKSIFWWKITDEKNVDEDAYVPSNDYPNGHAIHSLSTSEQYSYLQNLIHEQAVALLNTDRQTLVDPQRSLIELGLDSIGAVTMSEKLGELLDLSLPATLLFDHPTVGDLTAYLSGKLSEQNK